MVNPTQPGDSPASTVRLPLDAVVADGPDDDGDDGPAVRDTTLVGTTVEGGAVRLDALVAEGGMGQVFRGTVVASGAPVAVKVLHAALAERPNQRRRFLKEARAAARIDDPAVVRIEGTGELEGGRVYLVMEWLAGEDLHALLEREGRLTWVRARELVLPICRALEAAHDAGVIHRDLKPSNCFLARGPDGSERIKVVDFGIAKLDEGEDATKLTQTGSVMGTAEYMAPEQARGEPVDARADVYAVGCMLYQLLTGSVPFRGTSFMAVLTKHLTEPVVPPSVVAPDADFPAELDAVIVRALAKNRSDRYGSARALRQALEAVPLDGRPARDRSARAEHDRLGGATSLASDAPLFDSFGPIEPPAHQLEPPAPAIVAAPAPIAPVPVARPPARAAVPWWALAGGLAAVGLVAWAFVATSSSTDRGAAAVGPAPATGEAATSAATQAAAPDPAAALAQAPNEPVEPMPARPIASGVTLSDAEFERGIKPVDLSPCREHAGGATQVTVHLQIEAIRGQVLDARATNPASAALTACLQTQLRAAKFPRKKARGGEVIDLGRTLALEPARP